MSKNPLFVNKKVWQQFTEEETEKYIDDVFNHYRSAGFPYFPTDKAFRDREIIKMSGYDYRKCIDKENKIIKQAMHGLSLAWSFMPHSWEIQCGGKKTPYDVFHDDESLRGAIKKRMQMGDNMSDNGLRKTIKIYKGAQSVSNFRPTAAAALYKVFCPPNGTVLDMSCGYGGRLLGARLANVKYIGTDPCEKTMNGLKEMCDMYMKNYDIELHQLGSEVFVPEENSIDFAFTSPPYFDWEAYSNEETQSYVKFDTKEAWVNGFLGGTFRNVHKGLKDNCFMAINIANTKTHPTLEEETVRVAEENGFKLVDEWKLSLSNPKMSSNKHAFKYEPIFIFEKIPCI